MAHLQFTLYFKCILIMELKEESFIVVHVQSMCVYIYLQNKKTMFYLKTKKELVSLLNLRIQK
jgi:hypothetical protein